MTACPTWGGSCASQPVRRLTWLPPLRASGSRHDAVRRATRRSRADQPWDGRRSMRLACGDGRDFPAGDDPDADKAALEASYRDPLVREPFIAALARASRLAGSA